MAEVAEHLPSKHEALSSHPSREKNKQQQKTLGVKKILKVEQ
jgi:hypothetical protein